MPTTVERLRVAAEADVRQATQRLEALDRKLQSLARRRYTIGVTANADTRGLREELRAAVGRAGRGLHAGVDIQADTTALREELRAAVGRAGRGLHAGVDVRADTGGLREELRAAVARASHNVAATIGVRLDTTGLRERVRAAAARASHNVAAEVGVRLDTTGLRTRIRVAAAAAGHGVNAPIGVNVNAGGARRSVSLAAQRASRGILAKIGISFDSRDLRRGLTTLSRGVQGLRTAGLDVFVLSLAKLAAELFAVASAAAPAIGLLAAIPGVLGAAAAGIGSVALGFLGISDAVKAMTKVETDAARSTSAAAGQRTSAARQVAAAQRGIAEAARDAARAQRDGARQVQAAEVDLADAQRATRLATEDLTRARREAAEQLQDLRIQVRGSALDEEDALLGVERARQRLAEVTADPLSSALDRREADLAARQAVQRLDEVRERNVDLRHEYAATSRAGVAGAEGVLAAQGRLADARRDEHDAAVSLRRAQEEAAERLVDADRRVVDAHRALAEAFADAGTAGAGASASQTALGVALANLSPAGQRFARFVHDKLVPAFQSVQFAVQQALLPPLQTAITRGLTLLPMLRNALVDAARRVGVLAGEFTRLVTSKSFSADLKTILASNNRALTTFGQAGIVGVDILRHLSVAAAPLVEWLAKLTLKLAESALKFIVNARESGALARFFERTRTVTSQLLRIVGNLTFGLIQLGIAAAPTGQGLLDMIEDWTEKFRKFTDEIGPKIAGVVANLGGFRAAAEKVSGALQGLILIRLGAAFGPWGFAIGLVAGGLAYLWHTSESFRDAVGKLVDMGKRNLVPMLEQVATWFRERVLPELRRFGGWVTRFIVPALGGLWQAWLDNRSAIMEMVGSLAVVSKTWLPILFVALRTAIAIITTTITVIGGIAREFNGVRTAVLDATGKIVRYFIDMAGEIVNNAARAFGWVPGLGPKLRDAAAKFNTFRDDANRALGGIADEGITVQANFGFAGLKEFRTATGLKMLARGGYVTGPGTSTSDSVPARLSRGEYVVNAQAVRRVGLPAMDRLNAAGFARGGLVGDAGDAPGIRITPFGSVSRLEAGLVELDKALGSLAESIRRGLVRQLQAGGISPAAGPVLQFAQKQLGEPYQWGATGPDRWDCSGLMLRAFERAGIRLPRVSREQAHAGRAVSRPQARLGDLIYFGSPVHHIGLYLGGDRMLHAPHTGDVVRYASGRVGTGYRRVLPDMRVTSSVHAYDRGGWIREPLDAVGRVSGQRYTLGERESELVTPASRVGGGQVQFTYAPQITLPAGSDRTIERRVEAALERHWTAAYTELAGRLGVR